MPIQWRGSRSDSKSISRVVFRSGEGCGPFGLHTPTAPFGPELGSGVKAPLPFAPPERSEVAEGGGGSGSRSEAAGGQGPPELSASRPLLQDHVT